MTSDSSDPQDPVQAGEALADQSANAVRATAADASADLEQAAATVADRMDAANREAVRAAETASRTTSDAFGAARERLSAMTGAMPEPVQDLFRPFQTGGDTFGKGLGSSYATAMEGMAEFNSKAIAAWRSNAEQTIRHWQSLVGVKSLSEAVALSAEHTRHQLEAVTTQTRELSALATRIVRDAADPLKLTGR